MDSPLTCPPCTASCVQGRACTHQPIIEPATDSDLQRWLEEADEEARHEHDGRALGWAVAIVIAVVFYGGAWLVWRLA